MSNSFCLVCMKNALTGCRMITLRKRTIFVSMQTLDSFTQTERFKF